MNGDTDHVRAGGFRELVIRVHRHDGSRHDLAHRNTLSAASWQNAEASIDNVAGHDIGNA